MQQNAIQRNDTNTKLGITNTQNNDAQANTHIVMALSITTLSTGNTKGGQGSVPLTFSLR
jgi:hypothetical protein